MINYNDLHKVYKPHLYNLPDINEKPQPVIQQQVVVKEPVVNQEEVTYMHTRFDDPARDLVKTLAGYGLGIALAKWLGFGQEGGKNPNDPNNFYTDLVDPPPGWSQKR